MVRHSLRVLPIGAVALLLALTLAPAPAAAVTPLAACGPLTQAGETYVLTADITASGDATCFRVRADRITIDLAGHTVTGMGGVGAGVWDEGTPRISTVVKNGSFRSFSGGILLGSSTRNTVRSVTTSDNSQGMVIGDTSLVKDCTVQRNTGHGIVTGDSVQVEDCYVGGTGGSDANGGFGIIGGQRMLVTRNWVNGNGQGGILVGAFSTVTHTRSNQNNGDGIAVGQRSLVSNNTANNNAQDGIEAVCPSTVTHNTATGNGAMNYNPIGVGCHDAHNTFGPVGPPV